MRCFLFLAITLMLFHNASAGLKDSLLSCGERISDEPFFYPKEVAVRFYKNTALIKHRSTGYLDTLIQLIDFYEDCTLDIYPEQFNKQPATLNTKRIQVVLSELALRTDTTGITIRIFERGQCPHEFDGIFGPNKAAQKQFQNEIITGVYSTKTHLLGEAQAFTGYHLSTYENDSIRELRHFLDGRLEGRSYYWYSNGKTAAIHTYCDGHWHGEITRLYENGQMRSSGHYQMGIKQGEFRYWNQEGRLTLIRTYDKNVMINQFYP